MRERLDEETRIELLRLIAGTGVTQADIGDRLGLDESAMSRILWGRRAVPEGFVENFRQAFQAIRAAHAPATPETAGAH